METMADGGTKHEGLPKEKRGWGKRGGLGGRGRRGEERGVGIEESGGTRAEWRLWNRGSMCRPRVQRVASACALTSSRSLSLFPPFCVYPEPLIRRERGDNSSPSLSLDDARFPLTSSLNWWFRPSFSCPPSSADTLLSLSLRCLVSLTGRDQVLKTFPSAFCDTDTVTALRGWGSRCGPVLLSLSLR